LLAASGPCCHQSSFCYSVHCRKLVANPVLYQILGGWIQHAQWTASQGKNPISFSPPVKTGILPLPTCNDPGPEELSTGVESVTLDIESMTRPGADNAKLIWTEPYRSAHMAFMNNKTSMQVSCGAHMVPAQPGQVNTHTKPWDPSV